jgi:citrate lyase subunit beta / citryl-CoA lyase
MPANRENMLAKAPTYGADALVFDLEDAVPLAEKPKARELAHEFIDKLGHAALIYVRVNAFPTGMLEDDLDAVVARGLASIRLPKAESAEDIRTIDALLTRLEKERGLPANAIDICPSLESAKGVWFAYEIASSSPRVRSIMCGTAENGDLQGDLGYTWTAEGQEKLYVRSRVLLAARAAGVEHVLDGAFSNVRDPEALRIDCEAARKLGYRGRSVIHPNQVEIVNRVFRPTEEELDYYRRVVEAFDGAVARGSAATTVDGKLVDYAMVATAKRVMAWADGLTP